MPRRPGARLFDGTARAWAAVVVRSAYAGTERRYEPFGDPFACAVQARAGNLADRGPGESEVGTWKVYAPMDAVRIRNEMVLEILTGPEAGKTVRAVSDYAPRGRFQQITCTEWDGVLDDDDGGGS